MRPVARDVRKRFTSTRWRRSSPRQSDQCVDALVGSWRLVEHPRSFRAPRRARGTARSTLLPGLDDEPDLRDQLNDLRAYCAARRWTDVHEYTDHGVSEDERHRLGEPDAAAPLVWRSRC